MPKEEKAAETPQPASNPSSGSSDGLDPKVGGLLAYLFGFVSGIKLYLISKDPYIRFHALQSTIFFIAIWIAILVLTFIPVINLITPILYLLEIVMWIVLMVKAYQGEKFKLPVIGDMAEERA